MPGRNIWRTTWITCTDIKSSTVTTDSLFANGFTAIGRDLEWHYDHQFTRRSTSDETMHQANSMFVNAKNKTPDHLVLLAHDQVYDDPTDSAELHQFITKLKQQMNIILKQLAGIPD